MRKFNKGQRLPHDWATMAVSLRKFQHAQTTQDRSEHGQRALDLMAALLDTHGDAMREAIAVVSNAEGEVNASRSQQIAQYHRNHIHKAEQSIGNIDQTLNENADDLSPIKTAELTSQREALAYQLEDHSQKIDRRSHGVHLAKMRRKHR